jgi:excisionase family DNA binding protein
MRNGACREVMNWDKILVSKREAAKALSISLRTLDYLIASKEISARRIGRRVLIPRKALEHFARSDHPTRTNGEGANR